MGASTLKVLLVDDDPSMRRLVHRVLAGDFQSEVCEVDDGLTALEKLQSEAFDLIVLDLHMKVIDGTETLQALRRTVAYRNLPVVIISGTTDVARVKQLVGLNVAEIIAKPFQPSKLRERLTPVMLKLQTNGSATPAPVRARLNLRPTSRVLLVGPRDRFRDFLYEHLRDVCDVQTFDSAATGLRDALSRSADAVFITGDDVLLPPALFARKVRPPSSALPRVYLSEPSAAPFSDDTRWFDGRLNKVSSSKELFTELHPLLTTSGLALALLPPKSPLVDGLWISAAEMVQGSLQTSATVGSQPPLLDATDHRTVEASAEVNVDEVTWTIEILLTHEYALRHASGLRGDASADLLSEADVLEAATAFVKVLAVAVRDLLAERDVSAHLGTIFARATEGYGKFPDAGNARWVTFAEGSRLAAGALMSVTCR